MMGKEDIANASSGFARQQSLGRGQDVTRDELAQALAAAGVDEREFDLNGSASIDDAWVLEDDHGIWGASGISVGGRV